MNTMELLQHLNNRYPHMGTRIEIIDGFTVVSFVNDGDVVTDPIEMEHRGIVGDYGYSLLIEPDAQLISDHNEAYNTWLCSGQ